MFFFFGADCTLFYIPDFFLLRFFLFYPGSGGPGYASFSALLSEALYPYFIPFSACLRDVLGQGAGLGMAVYFVPVTNVFKWGMAKSRWDGKDGNEP